MLGVRYSLRTLKESGAAVPGGCYSLVRLFFFVAMDLSVYWTLLVIAVVLVAAVTDFLWQKIPNLLTFPSMLIGMSGHTLANGWEGLQMSLLGLAVGSGTLIGFYILGGMAAGDVKLLGAVGSIIGPQDVFLVFLMTAILGGVYSIGVMVGLFGARGMAQRVTGIFQTWFLTKDLSFAFASPSKKQPKLRYGLRSEEHTSELQSH